MSADNGIYVLPSPVSSNLTRLEYRVAYASGGIEDLGYFPEETEKGQAMQVVFFMGAPVYAHEDEARHYADSLRKDYKSTIEHGICVLPARALPYPENITYAQACTILTYGC